MRRSVVRYKFKLDLHMLLYLCYYRIVLQFPQNCSGGADVKGVLKLKLIMILVFTVDFGMHYVRSEQRIP